MWKDTVDGLTAECQYLKATHEFKVTVSRNPSHIKTKNFPASFEPIFGMDVMDQHMSGKIAEELALEIEKEERESKT